MPRRRVSTTNYTSSEGESASSDSTVPAPPPGIDQFFRGPSGAAAGGASPGAKGKQEEDKQRQPALFHKTKMCKFNQLGLCTRGEFCSFAHGGLDMNPLPDLSRTKLCKELINTGQCSQAGCKFAHNKHEIRRHPFVPNGGINNGEHCRRQAGANAAAQLGQTRPAPAMCEAGLGQEVALLQASASLLYSDLANILSRMREKDFMRAHMQQRQGDTSMLYSDLAYVRKGVSEKGPLEGRTWKSQMSAGPISDFGGALGSLDDEGLATTWGQADRENLLTAGYLSQGVLNCYPGGAHPAEMDRLAPAAFTVQDFYESQLEDSPRFLQSMTDEVLQQKPEPKLLSPMYAPSVSLTSLPPFTLA